MLDSAFLAYFLERFIREDPAYKIKALHDVVFVGLKHKVSHYKVWDVKQKAVTAIYGDFKESYAELPRFLARLKAANSDTKYKLKVDDNYERGTCTFNSLFWVFGPSRLGFRHCRPVISIDATHLYGKYRGKLMIAIATDANNKIYPLVFAIVETESTETWGWFLACIRKYVTDQSNLCIISDRHPGILSVFRDTSRRYLQPPMTEHRFCIRHLCSNVNTRWKNETLKNLVYRAASATQQRKFNHTYDLIENVKREAHRYLNSVPRKKWALAFDKGFCYGAITTNVSECFNGALKGARSLPITAMVKYTYFKLNAYFDDRRNKSIAQLQSGKKWCKYALDIFMKNKAKAEYHRVMRMSMQQQVYQVDTPNNLGCTDKGNHTHSVNLLQRTCTCQKWKLYKIPCSHVIAVCSRFRHDAKQYIDPCYSVDALFHSYAPVFPPLKDRLSWPDSKETRRVIPNPPN